MKWNTPLRLWATSMSHWLAHDFNILWVFFFFDCLVRMNCIFHAVKTSCAFVQWQMLGARLRSKLSGSISFCRTQRQNFIPSCFTFSLSFSGRRQRRVWQRVQVTSQRVWWALAGWCHSKCSRARRPCRPSVQLLFGCWGMDWMIEAPFASSVRMGRGKLMGCGA